MATTNAWHLAGQDIHFTVPVIVFVLLPAVPGRPGRPTRRPTEPIGRAGIHTINEQHAAVAPLRALLDPVADLRNAVSSVTGTDISAVIFVRVDRPG